MRRITISSQVAADYRKKPSFVRTADNGQKPFSYVDLGGGDIVRVTHGQIDDDSHYAYKNGQCLALAVALSKHTGWPIHTTSFVDPDGNNEELRHAAVVTPEGMHLDIGGVNDPSAAEEYDENPVHRIYQPGEADQALRDHRLSLPMQDVKTAEHFVKPVMDAYREDQAYQKGTGPE